MIVALAAVAFGAPLVSPRDRCDPAQLDRLGAFPPPGTEGSGGYVHRLGTDTAVRDRLSDIVRGLRTSFLIGLSAASSRTRRPPRCRGRADAGRGPAAVDARHPAGPRHGGRAGTGAAQIALALVVAQGAYFARTAHGVATVERGEDCIEAARGTPLPARRILPPHLMPDVMPPLIVVATVQVGSASALEATLSILGVGLPMTSSPAGSRASTPGCRSLRGLFLVVAVTAIDLVGDGVRSVLGPKRARGRPRSPRGA